MSSFLILIGGVVVVYTIVALLFGFPHLSDFLPISLAIDGEGKYYKVVPSESKDYGPWFVGLLSLTILALGLILRYAVKK